MLVKTSASIAICLGAAAVSASPLVGREPKRVPAITSSGPASSQGEGNADVNIVNKNEIYDLLMGCAQQDGIFCGVACTPKTAKCCHSKWIG